MINKKEIHKIASLAKIDIQNDELDEYSKQISKILEYINILNEVDTSNVDEFSNDLLNENQNLRKDIPEEPLDREQVMKLAPESDGVYFKVPKIIKEKEE